MEANFFRCLAKELQQVLPGQRIEKIYESAPHAWTIKLGASLFLLFGHTLEGPFLFVDQAKPENPQTPSAHAMWLRKRVKNRKIASVSWDWPNRILYIRVGGNEPLYVKLECLKPPAIVSEVSVKEPSWPPLPAILENKTIWKEFPQITPFLRKALTSLDPVTATRMLTSLQKGACDQLYLYDTGGSGEVLPYTLPHTKEVMVFQSSLSAAAHIGRMRLFSKEKQIREARQFLKKKLKRLKKTIQNVKQDQNRALKMKALSETADRIHAHLYQLNSSEKVDRLTLQDHEGKEITLQLDPSKTIQENMAFLYKRSAKGKRGLKTTTQRIKQLEKEYDGLVKQKHQPDNLLQHVTEHKVQKSQPKTQAKARKISNIHTYISSDDFRLYRGKNSKANHTLLSTLAQSHDYWFHATDGPGSHVVLHRDFPTQDVPEQTMLEAAMIAGLSSHYSHSGSAEVMCALVKDVRKVKGFAPGQVRVDKVMRVIKTPLDREKEQQLLVKK